MKRFLFLLICLASVVSLGRADTENSEVKFKSPQANDAVAACATAEAAAKAAYDKAMIAAKTKLIAELEICKNIATRADDLDEAVKLQAKIAAAKDEIAAISAKPNSSPIGAWSVAIKGPNTNSHYTMRLEADGTATIGDATFTVKGKWKIDNANLVISWNNKTEYDYTARKGDSILGKDSQKNDLTATRITDSTSSDSK